ncbi:hypothetical protein C8J56DRAFT_1041866 [Mycena floridula]|nr:hypothetical protein C8J56DRAFT_1041866 [Mycena floridula]
MFTFLFTFYALLNVGGLYVGASDVSCTCSPVIIPTKVDVLVPKDPTDPSAGLKSNSSDLRSVNETYNIYGVFCQPQTSAREDVVQLLVHGITYTNQYWSPATEEFQNYSYPSFSCERGFSSLAIDGLGVGLSSRPVNASDVQFPTSASVLSKVAQYLKTSSILSGVKPFSKVIGVGHSLGSALLSFGAIVEGAQFPFDSLVLTGFLSITTLPPGDTELIFPGRDVDPLRWSGLDPNYITTKTRDPFYPSNPNSFSPRMLLLDDLAKDVGSISTFDQLVSVAVPAQHYQGNVAKVLGSEDKFFCLNDGCSDVATLNKSQSIFWPAAKSFDLVVMSGSGHDLNLDFFAAESYNTFSSFVEQFAGLN